MPITIKDIAKVAGVSHTTVSRALNGNPAISSETRQRIEKLAHDMGYVPSAVAQSLLSRQTFTVGMVVTSIADPFISRVVEGVENIAQATNYSVFLATSYNNPEQEIRIVETLQRRRVDGIIVTSSKVGSIYSERQDQIQVPIVLINNQEPGDYLYSVGVDDIRGARLAVEHLIGLGHRQIGYIGTASRPNSNRHRFEGYRLALEQAGLVFDPALVFLPETMDDFRCGEAALSRCLAQRVTAVFCYNDLTAIGILKACQRQGVTVPDQLSVIGFDNIEATLYVTPTLTTIHQPRRRMGEMAMTMLLNIFAGQSPQDKLLPGELVVRESTRPIN